MSQNLHEKPVVAPENKMQNQDDSASIRTMSTIEQRPSLTQFQSHLSHGQDAPIQQYSSYIEVSDEVYDRIKPSKKVVIVALLSFCSFLAPVSSTTILSAVPEVAATYHSTGTIINLSNALYMLFMGLSPCFWVRYLRYILQCPY
jgi:hypothetical protein